MVKLENGNYEYKTGSGQIYRGASEADLIDQLGKATFYGTREIANLRGKQPPVEHQQIQPGQIDPTALAIADLTAQGLGFSNAEELKNFTQQFQGIQETVQQQQMNNEAARFLAAVPDYPNSDYNNQKLEGLMEEMGLPPTTQAMMMAHNHLKAMGAYEAVNRPAVAQRPGMPLPPNGVSSPVQEQNAWTMPLSDLEAMIRNGRG